MLSLAEAPREPHLPAQAAFADLMALAAANRAAFLADTPLTHQPAQSGRQPVGNTEFDRMRQQFENLLNQDPDVPGDEAGRHELVGRIPAVDPDTGTAPASTLSPLLRCARWSARRTITEVVSEHRRRLVRWLN